MRISKYEFNTEKLADKKIAALPHTTDDDGNRHPAHRHTVVKIGHIVVENGEYNEEGKETKAPVLSKKYSVDVLWKDLEETDEDGNVTIEHPKGWKSKALDLEGEGVHGFLGLSYQDYKL
jgi:hypothetical protein